MLDPVSFTLYTDRLILRPLALSDAPRLATLANDREIAANTLSIPHPYTLADAEEWIRRHLDGTTANEYTFAITLRQGGALIGAMGIQVFADSHRGEIGYWIGRDFWGQQYTTEAASALLDFGFNQLDLNRIHAAHFSHNSASGRVMQKLGMRYEGLLRQHAYKWGKPQDLCMYGILRNEFRPFDMETNETIRNSEVRD